MYRTRESICHENINNASLIFCTKLAQKVKEPPYIPFLEVYTYGLVARYFELSETRIKNAYTSNIQWFLDDCTQISGKNIAMYATDKKSLGKHYGYLCGFPNGVMTNVAFSSNTVFNSRALLHFAVLLWEESDVANSIFQMLNANKYHNHGYLARNKPWFLMESANTEPKAAVDICPFIKMQMKNGCHPVDTAPAKPVDSSPMKLKSKRKGSSRRCARVDERGKILEVYDSVTDAAKYYGISKANIYNVVLGVTKKTFIDGEPYRFKYID